MEHLSNILEFHHALGNHFSHISCCHHLSVEFGKIVCKLLRDIKSCFSELPYFRCSQIICGFHLAKGQNKTTHIYSKTSGNVGKFFCSTNQLVCLYTIRSNLLCIGVQLHDRERRFQRKLLYFRKHFIRFLLVLYDRAKSNLLQLELSAHIYHVL